MVSNIIYFLFHIWDVILPIDFHMFQRGRYTTNQLCLVDDSGDSYGPVGGPLSQEIAGVHCDGSEVELQISNSWQKLDYSLIDPHRSS